jgi:hypothetical protein
MDKELKNFRKDLKKACKSLGKEGLAEGKTVEYMVAARALMDGYGYEAGEVEINIDSLLESGKGKIELIEEGGKKWLRYGKFDDEKSSIKIDADVQRRLNQFKYRYGHKNINELISTALDAYEKSKGA